MKTILASLALAMLVAAPASAQTQEQYFSGKTITLIVGSAPGGAVDFIARLYAKVAPKHHPGKPNFIVQNVPGGGQLRGLQQGMRAKPDGLTVSLFIHTRWAVASILGEDLAPFDIRTARIIGAPFAAERNEMICANTKQFQSWKQVSAANPLKIGSAEKGARNSLGAVAIEMAGGPIKNIYGYGGSAEIAAAFDRGELSGVSCTEQTVPRLYPEWLTEKRLTPLFYWGAAPSEAYLARMGSSEKPVKVVDLPGVNLKAETRVTLEVAQKMNLYTTAFALPPGTQEEVYRTWKTVFEKVIQDPESVEIANAGSVEIGLGRAEDFAQSIDVAGKLSPEAMKLFKELMGADQ